MTAAEYAQMKEETVDQIKEFTGTLDRMNKGDVTLHSQFSRMRHSIRTAIATAFNASETIKMFGDQSVQELESQLAALDQALRLRRIDAAQHEHEKVTILRQLQHLGHSLAEPDQFFFDTRHERLYQQMEQIEDEGGDADANGDGGVAGNAAAAEWCLNINIYEHNVLCILHNNINRGIIIIILWCLYLW